MGHSELMGHLVNNSNNKTVVEGDPKTPFSLATTPRCKGEHYSFPLIAPLDP